MRNTAGRLVAATALVLVVACGKRGDPRPPVPVIPQATSDLVVTQRADKVILSWSYPALTTAGRSLTGVRRVVVYRYVEPLPGETTPGIADPLPNPGPNPDQPASITQFGTIPGLSPTQFIKLREQVDSIEGARLPAATSGAKLLFEDKPPFTTSDSRPVRLTYAVVTEGEEMKSDLSNLAMIVPVDPGAPPTEVRAEPNAQGVKLSWKPAADTRLRFNVYRTAPGELPDEFGTPINATPIDKTNYDDAPAYGTYDYRVTVVASPGPPRVESGLSAAANVTFKDLVPPPPPTNITVLVETSRIARLIWDPVDAPDLRGYNVYRTEGTARLLLTPHPAQQTFFGDESLQHGVNYFYSVTSVDKSGNESAPTKSSNVIIPRTP
jgi:hypothetical protein